MSESFGDYDITFFDFENKSLSHCKLLLQYLYADTNASFFYNPWHLGGQVSSVVFVSGFLKDVNFEKG